MSLRLFVDDLRRCPDGWTPAQTVTEAIRILATQYVEEVSLDHDIMCETATGWCHTSPETFEAVAYYLSEMRRTEYGDHIKIKIHTANVEAGKRMAQIMGIKYNNEIYNEENYK